MGMSGRLLKLMCINLVLLTLVTACSASRPAPVSGVNARGQMKADGRHYIVVKGDTLYSIAFQVGTDVPTLARHNRIAPPYAIYPGQALRIDVPTRSQYRVKKGDTLFSIARRTGHKMPELAQLNGLTYPYHINVGQRLNLGTRVPNNKAVTISKPNAAPAKVATNKPKASSAPNTGKSSSTKGSAPLAPPSGKAYPAKADQKTATTSGAIAWRWPTEGQISSGFSLSETGNKGIDIKGHRGQAIRAAAAGKVVYAGNALRGYGNLIIIKHNDDYLSAYAHNEQLRVKEQETVSSGQHIADMGNSDTTDIGLHFEIRYQGTSVDPMKYLPKR